jgi:hypothetical protein
MVSERDCNTGVCDGSSDEPAMQGIRYLLMLDSVINKAHQIIITTLNFIASTKIGIIPTAIDVPMAATGDRK